MVTSSRDRITVDVKGLKGALLCRSAQLRVPLSVLIRRLLFDAVGHTVAEETLSTGAPTGVAQTGRSRLSVRMASKTIYAARAAAEHAGMPLGDFLAGLVAEVPILRTGGDRSLHMQSLMASTAELATLHRGLHTLVALLREGDVPAARAHRDIFERLNKDVRTHLTLAAATLADIRPRGGKTPVPISQTTERRP